MSTDTSVRRQVDGPYQLGISLFPRPVERISLYIHIPFCSNRCRYCNFYFETGWSPQVLKRTLDTILVESRAMLPFLFPTGDAQVHTVYFGGGTPSIIPPASLDAFLTDFRAIWQLGTGQSGTIPEIAFEANPETLGWELLEVLGRHQVNRLSLGVQSFSSDALQLLGRRAAEADVDRALRCIQKARNAGVWRGALNCDLICGIPGQTAESLSSDIDRLLDFGLDHLSLYTLTVEPETPLQQLFDQGLRQPMPAEAVEAMWDRADSRLETAGFRNYEVSNYARPGFESRHNLAYWELAPYLGLGPGAVGTIPVSLCNVDAQTSRNAIARLTNPAAMAYSRPSRQGWEHSVELLSSRDFLIDHFLTGLRVAGGVDLSRLESIFHLEPGRLLDLLAPSRRLWQEKGWIDVEIPEQTKLGLSRNGRFVLNILLGDLMETIDRAPNLLKNQSCPDWPINI